MSKTTDINHRIGDALLSGGKYDIISANSNEEEELLISAGFVRVGAMKLGDEVIALYKIEIQPSVITKVVEVPSITPATYPWSKQVPYRNTDIWYNNQPTIGTPFSPSEPLYTYGTGIETHQIDGKNDDTKNIFGGILSTRLDSSYPVSEQTYKNK